MSELYRENTGWTQIYNDVIDGLEEPLSHPAFRLYVFLCKCAGQKGEAFPGYRTICRECRIGSRSTVKKALDELVSYGLIRVRNRKKKMPNGNVRQRSNMYILKNHPHAHLLKQDEFDFDEVDDAPDEENGKNDTLASRVDTGADSISGTPTVPGRYSECAGAVQSLDRGGTLDVPVKNNHLKRITQKEGGGDAAQDPTPKKEYGEFGKVKLTDGERIALVTDFGENQTAACISRMDSYCAGNAKEYANCYAMLRNWLSRDNKSQSPSSNRFANFKQRDVSEYAEFEKLEREQRIRLAQKIKAEKEGQYEND